MTGIYLCPSAFCLSISGSSSFRRLFFFFFHKSTILFFSSIFFFLLLARCWYEQPLLSKPKWKVHHMRSFFLNAESLAWPAGVYVCVHGLQAVVVLLLLRVECHLYLIRACSISSLHRQTQTFWQSKQCIHQLRVESWYLCCIVQTLLNDQQSSSYLEESCRLSISWVPHHQILIEKRKKKTLCLFLSLFYSLNRDGRVRNGDHSHEWSCLCAVTLCIW